MPACVPNVLKPVATPRNAGSSSVFSRVLTDGQRSKQRGGGQTHVRDRRANALPDLQVCVIISLQCQPRMSMLLNIESRSRGQPCLLPTVAAGFHVHDQPAAHDNAHRPDTHLSMTKLTLIIKHTVRLQTHNAGSSWLRPGQMRCRALWPALHLLGVCRRSTCTTGSRPPQLTHHVRGIAQARHETQHLLAVQQHH